MILLIQLKGIFLMFSLFSYHKMQEIVRIILFRLWLKMEVFVEVFRRSIIACSLSIENIKIILLIELRNNFVWDI